MQFVSPMPFQEAIDKLGSKTIVTSTLNSQEWSDVPVGLRDRAFFSATVENARFLQGGRDALADFLTNSRDENGMLKVGSRAEFVRQMSDFAQKSGMGPLDPDDAGTLKDITSQTRLSLIFNTQVQAAEDYGNWRQGMDPDLLDEFPAQRFIRVQDVKQPRIIHAQNENVVRLKTDLDFWLGMNSPLIGGFGVPWGPWGFNSGMGVEDVDRTEAEATGLVKPGEKLTPVEQDLNDHLEASTKGLDQDIIDQLQQSFGDQVEFDQDTDTIRWTGAVPDDVSGAVDFATDKLGVGDVLLNSPGGSWGANLPADQQLDVLRTIDKEYWELQQRYPNLPDKVSELVIAQSDRGQANLGAATVRRLVTKSQEFSDTAWKNINTWQKQTGLRWGTERQGNQIRDNFRHELAHVLSTPQILDDWRREISGLYSDDWFRKHISDYAAKDIYEQIAETFSLVTRTDYVRGTLPADIENFIFKRILGD